jgi:hypothetical protein
VRARVPGERIPRSRGEEERGLDARNNLIAQNYYRSSPFSPSSASPIKEN